MLISTILTVTSDGTFLGLLRQQLRDPAGSRVRMIVAGTMNDASALLERTRPQLIVVHWTGDRARFGQLDRLLWTTSVLARRTPVLVIAERYRIDQATMAMAQARPSVAGGEQPDKAWGSNNQVAAALTAQVG